MESLVNRGSFLAVYNGKKVLVTGHTGFKGSWLICWLNKLGAEIMGYALAPESDQSIYNYLSSKISHTSILADIRDKDRLRHEILQFQPDYIFHLAAQSLVRRSYSKPSETFEINTIGTANLLEAVYSLPKKCSLVVITTDKVYENHENDTLFKETDRLGGHDPYSASKACAEIVVQSFRHSFFDPVKLNGHKKPIATARAGNVIGGGDWNEDRLIPDIIRHLRKNEKIPVRNPDSIRPWQHVLEPLGGYLLLGSRLDAGITLSNSFNFGPHPDDHLKVRELVDIAIECWKGGAWVAASISGQPHEAGTLKLDITKAQEELGWNPKLNSAEAIQWTIDWYKQTIDTSYDFTIKQIKKFELL